MAQQVDPRIKDEATRISAEPGVQAVLLAGGRVTGRTWPGADVDLLVITEQGPARTEVADVDWTSFDTTYTTLPDLEARIAGTFMTCHACLHLMTLQGDEQLAPRLGALARQLYHRHLPSAAALDEARRAVGAAATTICVARGAGDAVVAAQAAGEMVWEAGHICLTSAGVGPIREDQWHDVLRDADLPFDAAPPYAGWFTGGTLEDRLVAAFTLADRTLGQTLPRAPIVGTPLPVPPPLVRRAIPSVDEAVELHRLVKAVGFGKMAKAEWLDDPVRQASELGVILWFAVPALLALGGVVAPEQRWWHAALHQAALPETVPTLYARALTAPSLTERKESGLTLGRTALDALEAIFRVAPQAHKYTRVPPHGG